jgi:hypothetical protein
VQRDSQKTERWSGFLNISLDFLSQSSESVNISRDLRENTRRLESLTARKYFYSDFVKRIWMSMA